MNPRPTGPRVYWPLLNNYVFSTQGDWDTTTLTNNGEEVLANRLFIHLRMRPGDKLGNPGPGEIVAVVFTQDNPDDECGLFPGIVTLDLPRHKIDIMNRDPNFEFEATRVSYQGIDVTPSVAEIFLEIDALQNVVQGSIGLYQNGRESDVETFAIL